MKEVETKAKTETKNNVILADANRLKEAKLSMGMYVKWATKTKQKSPTVAAYITDCIMGYPNNVKLPVWRLNARIRGIERQSTISEQNESLPITQHDLSLAKDQVLVYKGRLKAAKTNSK